MSFIESVDVDVGSMFHSGSAPSPCAPPLAAAAAVVLKGERKGNVEEQPTKKPEYLLCGSAPLSIVNNELLQLTSGARCSSDAH